MPDHTEPNAPLPEPSNLRFLRILVTVLTATMILGVAAIVVMLFLRLNQTPAQPPVLTGFDLPGDVAAQSASYTGDRIFVVGTDGVLYIFGTDRVLIQAVPLDQ